MVPGACMSKCKNNDKDNHVQEKWSINFTSWPRRHHAGVYDHALLVVAVTKAYYCQ